MPNNQSKKPSPSLEQLRDKLTTVQDRFNTIARACDSKDQDTKALLVVGKAILGIGTAFLSLCGTDTQPGKFNLGINIASYLPTLFSHAQAIGDIIRNEQNKPIIHDATTLAIGLLLFETLEYLLTYNDPLEAIGHVDFNEYISMFVANAKLEIEGEQKSSGLFLEAERVKKLLLELLRIISHRIVNYNNKDAAEPGLQSIKPRMEKVLAEYQEARKAFLAIQDKSENFQNGYKLFTQNFSSLSKSILTSVARLQSIQQAIAQLHALKALPYFQQDTFDQLSTIAKQASKWPPIILNFASFKVLDSDSASCVQRAQQMLKDRDNDLKDLQAKEKALQEAKAAAEATCKQQILDDLTKSLQQPLQAISEIESKISNSHNRDLHQQRDEVCAAIQSLSATQGELKKLLSEVPEAYAPVKEVYQFVLAEFKQQQREELNKPQSIMVRLKGNLEILEKQIEFNEKFSGLRSQAEIKHDLAVIEKTLSDSHEEVKRLESQQKQLKADQAQVNNELTQAEEALKQTEEAFNTLTQGKFNDKPLADGLSDAVKANQKDIEGQAKGLDEIIQCRKEQAQYGMLYLAHVDKLLAKASDKIAYESLDKLPRGFSFLLEMLGLTKEEWKKKREEDEAIFSFNSNRKTNHADFVKAIEKKNKEMEEQIKILSTPMGEDNLRLDSNDSLLTACDLNSKKQEFLQTRFLSVNESTLALYQLDYLIHVKKLLLHAVNLIPYTRLDELPGEYGYLLQMLALDSKTWQEKRAQDEKDKRECRNNNQALQAAIDKKMDALSKIVYAGKQLGQDYPTKNQYSRELKKIVVGYQDYQPKLEAIKKQSDELRHKIQANKEALRQAQDTHKLNTMQQVRLAWQRGFAICIEGLQSLEGELHKKQQALLDLTTKADKQLQTFKESLADATQDKSKLAVTLLPNGEVLEVSKMALDAFKNGAKFEETSSAINQLMADLQGLEERFSDLNLDVENAKKWRERLKESKDQLQKQLAGLAKQAEDIKTYQEKLVKQQKELDAAQQKQGEVKKARNTKLDALSKEAQLLIEFIQAKSNQLREREASKDLFSDLSVYEEIYKNLTSLQEQYTKDCNVAMQEFADDGFKRAFEGNQQGLQAALDDLLGTINYKKAKCQDNRQRFADHYCAKLDAYIAYRNRHYRVKDFFSSADKVARKQYIDSLKEALRNYVIDGEEAKLNTVLEAGASFKLGVFSSHEPDKSLAGIRRQIKGDLAKKFESLSWSAEIKNRRRNQL